MTRTNQPLLRLTLFPLITPLQLLSDKSKEQRMGMELVKALQRPDGKRGTWNKGVTWVREWVSVFGAPSKTLKDILIYHESNMYVYLWCVCVSMYKYVHRMPRFSMLNILLLLYYHVLLTSFLLCTERTCSARSFCTMRLYKSKWWKRIPSSVLPLQRFSVSLYVHTRKQEKGIEKERYSINACVRISG